MKGMRGHGFHGWILLLCLLLPHPFAQCAGLTLPQGTQRLEAGAFQNCAELQAVVAPEGLQSIGDAAFSGCRGLLEITLPGSLEAIGTDVLSGCSDSVWVHCPPSSAALAWARSVPLDYDADTVYRALLIGQSYTGTDKVLYGPANDARAMRFGLGNLTATSWSAVMVTNVSAAKLLTSISSTFAAATENDVSLFYYSGHGTEDGSLVGSDFQEVSPGALRQAMDAIPGRKIVIVDACYSGNLLPEYSSKGESSSGFNEHFLQAFSFRARGSSETGDYFVISSAGPRERAEEGSISSGRAAKIMGYFTHALCAGFGWDGITSRPCNIEADANADGAVSISEAAVYAIAAANSYNSGQNGLYYPLNASWFAPFRR